MLPRLTLFLGSRAHISIRLQSVQTRWILRRVQCCVGPQHNRINRYLLACPYIPYIPYIFPILISSHRISYIYIYVASMFVTPELLGCWAIQFNCPKPTHLSIRLSIAQLLSSHTTYPCPTHSLYRPHIHPYLSHLISLELSSYSAVPSAVKAQVGHQFLPICRCKRTLSHWESELQSWTSWKGCISVALGDIKMTMKYNESSLAAYPSIWVT